MPMFSILLPSRDRLDLLKLAIQSVLRQDFHSFEIVVSDNASAEDYAGHVASLRDPRVRYLQSDKPLSVTENWNTALKAAVGDYVIMLGDDDALTPGLLTRLSKIIERERKPTVLYLMAYHYTYPDVVPGNSDGSLLSICNSELFSRGDSPFTLDSQEAVGFARLAVSFQHAISFNAQHFVWRRDFTQTEPDFFQPPYPDYYACFHTFAKAGRIVVVPTPSIIIGIAKQSFGFFYANGKEAEGNIAFGQASELDDLGALDEEEVAALAFPGSIHYRNWLLTSIRYKHQEDPSAFIDFDRYRKVQIVESIAASIIDGTYEKGSEKSEWSSCGTFAAEVAAALQRATEHESDPASHVWQEKGRIFEKLQVYAPVQVQPVELTGHSNIMHAYDQLVALQSIGEKPPSLLSRFRRMIGLH